MTKTRRVDPQAVARALRSALTRSAARAARERDELAGAVELGCLRAWVEMFADELEHGREPRVIPPLETKP